ncbi:hypothetical protein llap_7399 [Limosa lapponica baueri]|uniref:Uncharacterized protein n=1 Tax=Limosa lapponica baueri TaxID=1758121 RepID=A0A2I0U8E3_LIMLA|nr:hypothetical protein llap_7399 [Limosa lapponica baueri]
MTSLRLAPGQESISAQKQAGGHEEFTLEAGPNRSNECPRDEAVNAFILLKVDKLVDRVVTWLLAFNEIKLAFAR